MFIFLRLHLYVYIFSPAATADPAENYGNQIARQRRARSLQNMLSISTQKSWCAHTTLQGDWEPRKAENNHSLCPTSSPRLMEECPAGLAGKSCEYECFVVCYGCAQEDRFCLTTASCMELEEGDGFQWVMLSKFVHFPHTRCDLDDSLLKEGEVCHSMLTSGTCAEGLVCTKPPSKEGVPAVADAAWHCKRPEAVLGQLGSICWSVHDMIFRDCAKGLKCVAPDSPVPLPDANRHCKVDKPLCKDDDEYNCPHWAARMECDLNPDFMNERCKKSCNMCRIGDWFRVVPWDDLPPGIKNRHYGWCKWAKSANSGISSMWKRVADDGGYEYEINIRCPPKSPECQAKFKVDHEECQSTLCLTQESNTCEIVPHVAVDPSGSSG